MSIFAGPNTITNDSNLILYLDAANKRSYPGSGNICYDLSSSTNTTGTLVNGILSNNKSFIFDGINDHIITSYDLSWNNTNSATIELICQTSVFNQRAGILGKPSPNWEWSIMHGQNGVTNSTLTFVYWNASGGHTNGPVISISDFFNSYNWIYIVITWNHLSNQIKIYKDSLLINTTNWLDASINQNRNNNIYIGGAIYTWNTGYWNGNIGFVKIYSKSLNDQEIRQNFKAIKSRYNL